ncbi:uncharacterized protein BJ212DRAFT_1278490, partial [Suillus subaureus]
VIISCFGLDMFHQTQSISLSTLMFSISETVRSHLNTLMNISVFLGQITGTSVGTDVFVGYGWCADSVLFMVMYVFQLAVLILRGSHCPWNCWFGYEGGLEVWKILPSKQSQLVANDDPENAECGHLAVVCSKKGGTKGGAEELC